MTDVVSTENSLLSVDYYRQKVLEFQQVLNDLDDTFTQLIEYQQLAYQVDDTDMIVDADSLLQTLTDKLSSIRTVAEGIQLASQGINAVGVDFPTITVPGGLGVIPLVPFAFAAGVIASALVIIEWSKGYWATVAASTKRAQTLDAIKNLPPKDQSEALATMQRLEEQVSVAQANANASPLTNLANIGKWIVLGGIAFFGYKLMTGKSHGYR